MPLHVVDTFDLTDDRVRAAIIPHCRLRPGEIWRDPVNGHIVACGDATDGGFLSDVCREGSSASLAIHDPPYNLHLFEQRTVGEYIKWCRKWLAGTAALLDDNSSLYVWLGADQNNQFQPLPQFMTMMAETDFVSRSFITMRNQRGYGTLKNWMAVRQELLYYTRGKPDFSVQYTDIPKTVRGYYKEVNGVRTENLERSRSRTIRAGNVWADLQQVFYRMEENVDGCQAQKPLKAIERIILASSKPGETVIDFFAHSGVTLLACERTGRRCLTLDIDPIYAEISIRRLERFRRIGKTGWGRGRPFESDLVPASEDPQVQSTTGTHT